VKPHINSVEVLAQPSKKGHIGLVGAGSLRPWGSSQIYPTILANLRIMTFEF